MESFLRRWRDDAAAQFQHESAIYIGDKVLALTDADEDAIALAKLHFAHGNYSRALQLLQRRDLVSKRLDCQYLTAFCQVKSGRHDDALRLLGDKTPTNVLFASNNGRRKIPRTGKTKSAKRNGIDHQTPVEEKDRETLRLYAGLSYLRGLCFAKQNAFDRAKEAYKEAVMLNVQCFEAFDQLMHNSLMSPQEEREFLEMLDFDSIQTDDTYTSQQAAELTGYLYQTRCSKYFNSYGQSNNSAIETLSTHYKLASNPDLLLAKAEVLFVQCRFREALSITEAILDNDANKLEALPIHLACLYELNEKNALFLLSHRLSDHYPDEAASWLAVGVYYLSIAKVAEARRMFSKSSIMNPHYGPAWIGFAHTFAAEGEHDQAIAAYTTSARLFQGTHLPHLFLGMQNLQLLNMTLAKEYLESAAALCEDDPLLLNERGVIAYHDGNLVQAADFFEASVHNAVSVHAEPQSWIATRINLGHAYRRLSRSEDALRQYDEVLRHGARDVAVLSAKAMVLMEVGKPWEAITALQEALEISAQDPIANELLSKALDEHANLELPVSPVGDQKVDAILSGRKQRLQRTR